MSKTDEYGPSRRQPEQWRPEEPRPEKDDSLHRSLQKVWESYLQERNSCTGIIEVNLETGAAVYTPRNGNEDGEAVELQAMEPESLRQLARKTGATNKHVRAAVSRLEHEDGKLNWLGVPPMDYHAKDAALLREALTDLSLDAQITWRAAELALTAGEAAASKGTPNLMSGYAPRWKHVTQAAHELMDHVEATTPVHELHEDHTWLTAQRTLTILNSIESSFDMSMYTKAAMTVHNLDNLRVLCIERRAHMANLEGDDDALDTIQPFLAEAHEKEERSRRTLRTTSLVTAISAP